MAKSKASRSLRNEVFMYLAAIMTAVLLAVAGLAWWAHTFIGDMVRTELAAQKVYFPPKGSPALDPATYPDLQQYAGQLVDTPEEAKAYANGFIGRHLAEVANGKVYSEVSTESMKDPDNKTLQQQKQTLFQGETLRGILLTSGYGFGTIGEIAGIAAIIAVGLAALCAACALGLRARA